MTRAVVLDTGPLSRACDPARNPHLEQWLEQLLGSGVVLVVPEIADYEARRGMLHRNMAKAISRLDQVKSELRYEPLSTSIMLRAAELWAQARKQGRPTADPKELDGDAILAAQTQSLQVRSQYDEVVVATENVGHLSLFVEARHWKEIS